MSASSNESVREKLILARQGDRQAREALVLENLALVKYLVKRFLGRGKEYDDLFQYGCIGLLKAIDRFDLDYSVSFSTYAVPVIIGEIRRFLRDDNPVHIARSISDNARRIEALRQEKRLAGEEEPTLEAIGRELGLNAADVALALNARQSVRSLSEPVTAHGEVPLQDTLGQDCMEEVENRLLLRELLGKLSEEDRRLLVRRYYFAHTQSRIAQDMGLTQVQVSRLEKRILKRLREMANAGQG